jgi:hypothetical protein
MKQRKKAKKLMDFFGKWPEAGKIAEIIKRDRKRFGTRNK